MPAIVEGAPPVCERLPESACLTGFLRTEDAGQAYTLCRAQGQLITI